MTRVKHPARLSIHQLDRGLHAPHRLTVKILLLPQDRGRTDGALIHENCGLAPAPASSMWSPTKARQLRSFICRGMPIAY
jgi:hypothetical protein